MNNLTQFITGASPYLSITAAAFALAGVFFLVTGLKRLRDRRLLASGFNGSLGIVLMLIAAIMLAVGLNLHTYQRLTHERPILMISFKKQSDNTYLATINHINGTKNDYRLSGDEWQLDARILSWEPFARLLGFNSLYRLERLAGRYSSVDDEKTEPRTVYDLSEETGLDIWELAREYQRWLSWLDAYYGSATYLPMSEGSSYIVSVTQNGLVARPTDETAKARLYEWQ